MTLFTDIKADQLAARKSKDTVKVNLLTTLLGDAVAVGKNDGNREITEAEMLKLVGKFLNNVNDTISAMKDVSNENGMADRYVNLLTEQSILEAYVKKYKPEQLSEEQLTEMVNEMVKFNTVEPNIGAIMKVLKSTHAGRFDGGVAKKVILQVLADTLGHK